MKSFLLPIGQSAGDSLPSVLSALSCGAALPVSGLDILHITDADPDPVLSSLIRDLNRMHALLLHPENASLFPSSFLFDSFRPVLPSVQRLSEDPVSSELIGALRGKGIPLSYKTDREAVEWAFSLLLSDQSSDGILPFRSWIGKISDSLASGEDVRIAVLCDLCDPFSSGAVFSLLRYMKELSLTDSCRIALFCLGVESGSDPELRKSVLFDSLKSLADQELVGKPGQTVPSYADAVWFFSMPASLVRGKDSLRILYAALARRLAHYFVTEKALPSGLHTAEFPSILTFQSLGDQAVPFASFLHTAVWLLADLLPSLFSYLDRPAALRSLSPNTRNGLFHRLFREQSDSAVIHEDLTVMKRVVSAVLSEVLSLIRFLPDHLRLSEVSDPVWQQIVDSCGRTVTVASEYAVSRDEAEEGGFLDIKPVHRVSMADTVEEKASRRLEDISVQLKNEREIRDSLFGSFGGCWKTPALLDCRKRCQDALDRSQEQQLHQPVDDRLSAAVLSRRIRLLRAAVEGCNRELSDPDPSPSGADSPLGSSGRLSPFSGQLLDASAAEKLFSLLVSSDDSAEPLRKELTGQLPSLLYGFSLSDGKSLFRRLLSCCKSSSVGDPLARLVLSALEVSRSEILPLHFLSSGKAPSVPMLPDLYPSAPLLTVSSLVSLLPSVALAGKDPETEKRGLLAMLFLRQYRRRKSDEAVLASECFHKGSSPVLDSWLSSHHSDRVWILSLAKDSDRLPFALILPGLGLVPARYTPAHLSLLPSFSSSWFDAEKLTFLDPCLLMSEGDLSVLLDLLARITDSGSAALSRPLVSFLKDFRSSLENTRQCSTLPDRMEIRLKAAFGLRPLPAFHGTLVRMPCPYESSLSSDAVAACLLGRPSFSASSADVPDDVVFLYRDVPFAREDSRLLLKAIPIPAENWILNLLDKECQILSRASDNYHDTMIREIGLLLGRYPEALPEARETARDLLDQASEPASDTSTELVWPWDSKSPSVLTILSESLGDSLAASAVQPFSDCLTLFPARGSEVIGDSLMASMCLLPCSSSPDENGDNPSVHPDAVLPPLSADFCASLCRYPEGRTLIRPDLLSFERKEEGVIRVILTLEGRFTVRLVHDYPEQEIIRLYSHDIPTLAVWPNLPFAEEDWHAYFIYAGLSSSMYLQAFCADGGSVSSAEGESRSVCRSGSFPLSFTLYREDRSLGSLPNVLPAPAADRTEPYTACIDFGSVGTSVVFSAGHRRLPMHGPTLVRTLLNNPASSQDLLRREFLPAVPVSALLPTASRIFRNVPGKEPLPFEDGIVLMSSDLQDVLSIPSGALYTCLKWEEEKGRSVMLCLHQIMLMAALHARSAGASGLSWRFAVPDEMAKAGRERLVALFSSLAEEVSRESGFKAPEKAPLITFAAESSALGAYFRYCASEDTRGGFMVMDIGACTADISLFLRGREQAVRTCQIPLGVHYMLLPSLLRDPDLLNRDLDFIQDPVIRRDLDLLTQILRNAKADSSALRHSRLALDTFIADRYPGLLPSLLQNPVTGLPTKVGSILLLHFSFLMMLSGLILLQIAADPGKNDFLPEQMSLCLSGRGSLLPEYLPDHCKTSLWRFLTMFRNRRVSSLSLLFSSEKKMEIPVGLSFLQTVSADLPPASAIPAAISVRPEELLPQFLLRFAKEFPASSEVLFHGFFTGDFYHPFTSYGESVVNETIAHSFTGQTALRPFDALSAWIGSLLDLVDSSGQ